MASLLPAVRKARLERNLVENRLQTKRAEQWPQLYVRYDQPLAATSTHSSTQGSWFVGFRYTPGAGFSTHAEAQAMATEAAALAAAAASSAETDDLDQA